MATAGDGRATNKSGGAGVSFLKGRSSQNSAGVSDQLGISASVSVTVGISELEQMLKQMTFTRSEAQNLIALVHSRTMEEESPSPLLRVETSTASGSLKKHKHGVVKEQITSAAELPKTPMASPQHPVATMMNLPEELLSKIFIRLLAKQLAQLRSVSKSWNTFLSQPSFIKSHLHHSIHNNDRVLLFFYHNASPFDSKQFTARSCQSPHLDLTNFIQLPMINPKSYCITVVGSVNGLICSSYGYYGIRIWNPSLSSVLTLPPYSTPSDGCSSIRIYLRFGYDPKTDDYKVFKLGELLTSDDNWWLPVEIYSMRKGSWDLITARFPSHITSISDDDLVCMDGHDGNLHWLGYTNKKTDSERIVAFNFSSETFREIPLPHSTVVFEHGRSNALGVLAGKLCVVSRVGDGTSEVWVMDEYGVTESWVKHHVFSRFIGETWPLAFTSHSEFLLHDYGHLSLYDSVANKTKIFENCCPGEDGAAKIVEYVDSLLWIAPPDVIDAGQN